ncbi:MAG: MFS transporter [Acidobacteriota bacterium]|nr:MFS transporter [Blastocatellia bacterium]MDW8411140.1 MFS transporter [Acidobacteriota bacterium]
MRKSFWQIWNLSFGFFGIQFGWGLQMANMSAIYERLGASPDEIPILWLAAPMTGLFVQPIVGSMSDRTWTRLGRRRPYFLVGAVLSSVALFLMPTASSVAVAALLLWVLDASINISMEPFRAFVADKLDDNQRTLGFVMQSFFIGLGASLSSALPFLFSSVGITGTTESGIPLTVKYSFQIGAATFLLAVLWTVVTTSEEQPNNLLVRQGVCYKATFSEIWTALWQMPAAMRQLAVVQVFTWLGLFCMWLFFGIAIARHVFGASDVSSQAYREGVEWGGLCFSVYSVVCFLVAFVLAALARRIGRKAVHATCLFVGGLSLVAVYVIKSKYLLLLPMVGVGIAWASILSMPYAIVSAALPAERVGVYMGIFNFFIVLPEITAALTFEHLVRDIFGNDPIYVVLLGGVFLLVAAVMVKFVKDS